MSFINMSNVKKNHLHFWREIGANDFVIDVIQNDYKIPLYTEPSKIFCMNNKSAFLESDFVCEPLNDLVDMC